MKMKEYLHRSMESVHGDPSSHIAMLKNIQLRIPQNSGNRIFSKSKYSEPFQGHLEIDPTRGRVAYWAPEWNGYFENIDR